MHWTALLAMRSRVRPDAIVADDLSCAGCGYNLRGMRAGGSCPECGAAVFSSLSALQAPDEVASGLRGLAYSFLGLPVPFLLVGFVTGSPGLGWLGVGLLILMALSRGAAALELRLRGKLTHIALIEARIGRLMLLAALELIAALGGGIALYVADQSVVAHQMIAAAALLWTGAVVAGLLTASTMGSALALLLGYDFVDRELRRCRLFMLWGIAAASIPGAAALIALTAAAPRAAIMPLVSALAILLIAWAIAAGFGILGLLHLAGAAERERDLREDVLDIPE